MSNLDRENERFHLLKETGKLPPRTLSNGKPKPIVTDTMRKNKRNAKKLKKSQKGAIHGRNLFFQQEERDIYDAVYAEFKQDIISKKGILSSADTILLKSLCIAHIRLYRKTRMESDFNKFFDRIVPQDPIAQITSLLKSLGLINDKSGKESNAGKELLAKLLSEESALEDDTKEKTSLNFEEWQQSQDDEGDDIELKLYTPPEASMFNTDFADMDDEEGKSDTLQFD